MLTIILIIHTYIALNRLGSDLLKANFVFQIGICLSKVRCNELIIFGQSTATVTATGGMSASHRVPTT